MAAVTPRTKTFQSQTKSSKTPTNIYRKSYLSPSSTSLTPQTPATLTPLRRSARHVSRKIDLGNEQENIGVPERESTEEMNLIRKRERAPRKRTTDDVQGKSKKPENLTTPKKITSKSEVNDKDSLVAEVSFSPVSPIRSETTTTKTGKNPEISSTRPNNKRVYYSKVEFDGVQFEVGDNVYVKRRGSDEEEDLLSFLGFLGFLRFLIWDF